MAVVMPLEVSVGGAIVFTFPVRRFVRLRGGSAPPATDQIYAPSGQPSSQPVSEEGRLEMNLILAIMQNEDADPVSGGLLAAGYRVTKLNTAGGFFRRGNVTLLIGVEEEKVEDALKIVQANCRTRRRCSPGGERHAVVWRDRLRPGCRAVCANVADERTKDQRPTSSTAGTQINGDRIFVLRLSSLVRSIE